jgi:hypothetical protein
MATYRYRWTYSEGSSDWSIIELPNNWSEQDIKDEMRRIEIDEQFAGSIWPIYGTVWSDFEYERLDDIIITIKGGCVYDIEMPQRSCFYYKIVDLDSGETISYKKAADE